jgi:hypothetical protein
MSEASRVLASSMDYADTLRRVARLVTEYCVYSLLERIEHVALERAEGSLRADLALFGLRLSHPSPGGGKV